MLVPSLVCLATKTLTATTAALNVSEQGNLLEKVIGLPVRVRDNVIQSLDIDIDIEAVSVWIDDESYWRKRFESNWKCGDIQKHGGSWKQAFFERSLQEKLETFDAENNDIAELQKFLGFSHKYIQTLEIRQLPSHIDLDLVFGHMGIGPMAITLRYHPGAIGMDYDRRLLVMRLSDCRSLAKVIEKSSALKSLDIGNNMIDDEMIELLCGAFIKSRSLTCLDLSRNQISDDGADALAKFFQNRTTLLTECRLADNHISMNGAHALAAALRTHQTLRLLDLSQNRIGDTGIQRLLEAVSDHPSLKQLFLRATNAEAAAVDALTALLKQNTTLRVIDISCNRLSSTGDALLTALDSNTTLQDLRLNCCGLKSDTLATIEELLLQRYTN